MHSEMDEYPEFDFLVHIEGFLVPLAHIRAIGWVEKTYPDAEQPYEKEQYYFRVHLDQPVGDQGDGVARDLAAFFDTEADAEAGRMRLAERVNDFYKSMYANMMFTNNIH
ncbi:hypothetical protein GGQ74_003138 [Desulfobaculum xiamenense]|uniref:Uncharacterized protein n=1 Tax=Desulfobaculum xiamenense TaxID=995050 RepID=A0A846QKH5_9BACT|nr:hypothetical protein [Desulfobaculum xiamenense]NJB69436.1 hypothetical protein [Desulfobaculum xiamenense]